MIEEQIYTALSELAGGRVYPVYMPIDNDSQYPAIVYSVIGLEAENSVCGTDEEGETRVQFDVYATDYLECLTLRKQLIDVVNTSFEACQKVSEVDGFEEEAKLFRRIIEFYL